MGVATYTRIIEAHLIKSSQSYSNLLMSLSRILAIRSISSNNNCSWGLCQIEGFQTITQFVYKVRWGLTSILPRSLSQGMQVSLNEKVIRIIERSRSSLTVPSKFPAMTQTKLMIFTKIMAQKTLKVSMTILYSLIEMVTAVKSK